MVSEEDRKKLAAKAVNAPNVTAGGDKYKPPTPGDVGSRAGPGQQNRGYNYSSYDKMSGEIKGSNPQTGAYQYNPQTGQMTGNIPNDQQQRIESAAVRNQISSANIEKQIAELERQKAQSDIDYQNKVASGNLSQGSIRQGNVTGKEIAAHIAQLKNQKESQKSAPETRSYSGVMTTSGKIYESAAEAKRQGQTVLKDRKGRDVTFEGDIRASAGYGQSNRGYNYLDTTDKKIVHGATPQGGAFAVYKETGLKEGNVPAAIAAAFPWTGQQTGKVPVQADYTKNFVTGEYQKSDTGFPVVTNDKVIYDRTGKGTPSDPFRASQPTEENRLANFANPVWKVGDKTFQDKKEADLFIASQTEGQYWTIPDAQGNPMTTKSGKILKFKSQESAQRYMEREGIGVQSSYLGFSPEGKAIQGPPNVKSEPFVGPVGNITFNYGEKRQNYIGAGVESALSELDKFQQWKPDNVFLSSAKTIVDPLAGLGKAGLATYAAGANLMGQLVKTPPQSWGDIFINGTDNAETRPIKIPETHTGVIIGGLIKGKNPDDIRKDSLEYLRRYGISSVLGESLIDVYGAKGVIQLGARGLKIGGKGVFYPVAEIERKAGTEYTVFGRTVASKTDEGYEMGSIKPKRENIPSDYSFEVGQGSKQQNRFNVAVAEILVKEGKMSRDELNLIKLATSAQAKSRTAPTTIRFEEPPPTTVKGLSERQGPILIESIKELQRGKDLPRGVSRLGQLGGSGAENRQLLPSLTRGEQIVPEDFDFALTGEKLTERAQAYASKVAKDLNVVAGEGEEFVASGPRLTKVSLLKEGKETKIVEFLDNKDLVSGNKEAVQSGLLFGKGLGGKGFRDPKTGLILERLPEQSVKRTTSVLTIQGEESILKQIRGFHGESSINVERKTVVAPLLKRAEKDIIKAYYDYKTLAENLKSVRVKNPIKNITNPKKGEALDIEAEQFKSLVQKINPKFDFGKLEKENREFLKTSRFEERQSVSATRKIMDLPQNVQPKTIVISARGTSIDESRSVSPRNMSPRTMSPRSVSSISRSTSPSYSVSKSPSSSLRTSPSSRYPSPRSPSSKSLTSKSPASKSPTSKSPSSPKVFSGSPASPRVFSPGSPSPKSKSPSSKSMASRSPTIFSPKPIVKPKPLIQLLPPEPPKPLLVMDIKSKKKKGKKEKERNVEFVGNTRLDAIEGLINRKEITTGYKTVNRLVREDKKRTFNPKFGLGFSNKKKLRL